MAELTTDRPVFVQYQQDVEPTDDHPTGFLFGETFEVASPAVAWDVHPDAVILRYADGLPYDERAARSTVQKASELSGKPLSRMTRDEVTAHAVELGIVTEDEAADLTVVELRDAVREHVDSVTQSTQTNEDGDEGSGQGSDDSDAS